MWWGPEGEDRSVREAVLRLEAQFLERLGDTGPDATDAAPDELRGGTGSVVAVGSVPPSVALSMGSSRWLPALMIDERAVPVQPPPGALPFAIASRALFDPDLRSWDIPDDTAVVLGPRPAPTAGWAHASRPVGIRGGAHGARRGVAGLVLVDEAGTEHVVTVGHLFDRGPLVERAAATGWTRWGTATWSVTPHQVSPNAGWDLATLQVADTVGLARPTALFDPERHDWLGGLGVRVTTPERPVDGETRPSGGVGLPSDGILTGVWTIGGDPPSRWRNCWTFTTAHQHLARGDSGSFAVTGDGEGLGLLVGGSVVEPDPTLVTMWIQDLRTAIAGARLPVALRPVHGSTEDVR